MDQLPRLRKRELICLLLFSCNYVVSVWRGFLFLWVLGMGYVILLWHSLSLPYNSFTGKVSPKCVSANADSVGFKLACIFHVWANTLYAIVILGIGRFHVLLKMCNKNGHSHLCLTLARLAFHMVLQDSIRWSANYIAINSTLEQQTRV